MHTPLHLWLVGGLSLLWNAGGAADYLLTRLRVPAYVAGMPPEALAMIDTAPLWFDVAWAVGVWSAVLGSLLLLMRSRHAPWVFALSLGGLIVGSLYSYVLAEPSALQILDTGLLLFSLAVAVVAVALWLYARAMRQRGHLT